jgi:group I intron endonuclease
MTTCKYHFTYITTNRINNKIYIGKHSTNNLSDGYFGSGKLLKQAISKYGIENFLCTIVEYYDSSEDAFKAEEVLIEEYKLTDNVLYNLVPGGLGGNKIDWTEERRLQQSINTSGKNNPMYGVPSSSLGKQRSLETCQNISNSLKGHVVTETTKHRISEARQLNPLIGEKNGMYGKQHTEESINKMRESASNRPDITDATKAKISIATQGSNNPMYGQGHKIQAEKNGRFGKKMKYMVKVIDAEYFDRKMVEVNDVPTYINDGWQLAYKLPNMKRQPK